MGLLDRLRGILNIGGGWSAARRAAWLRGDDDGVMNDAGVLVTEQTALTYATVYACVRLLSRTIAALPWRVYQQNGRRRDPYPNDPADWLISTQPNPEMNAFEWRELVLCDALLGGHHFSEIERDGAGRLVWLWPIERERVRIERDQVGSLVYMVRNGDRWAPIAPQNIYHLQGPMGLSPILQAARSIGIGIATDKLAANYFRNNAHLGIVYETEQNLQPEQVAKLRESIERRHAGPHNAARPAILSGGLKAKALTLPLEETQFLESRKFSVEEVCRWYGVPPHKVAAMDRATWANAEEMNIEFVTDSVVPWITAMEHEANVKFFGRNLRGTRYTKVNVNALLRGNFKARMEGYAQAVQNGILSPNDCRALEELNPYQGGDSYGLNSAWVPLDLLREKLEAEIEGMNNPPPPAAPTDPDADDDGAAPQNVITMPRTA